jgi:hypothetical protein
MHTYVLEEKMKGQGEQYKATSFLFNYIYFKICSLVTAMQKLEPYDIGITLKMLTWQQCQE